MKGKIFNTQEVQAIIAGTKTMFREALKTCKHHPNNLCQKVRNTHYGIYLKEDGLFWQPYGGSELQPFPYCDGKLSTSTSLDKFCPYQVGQKIFCKESFAVSYDLLQDIKYLSDSQKKFGFIGNDTADWKKRPAQHMKQEHSRLFLRITKIKVERLQDISEEDAIAQRPQYSIIDPFRNATPIDLFKILWNYTHKKPEEKWEANPWVFVYEFEVLDLKK